jgi:pectin methylesterase-like acyl-CoA thioesterase
MRREPTLGKILRTTWLLTLAVGLGACGSDTKKTPDAAAPPDTAKTPDLAQNPDVPPQPDTRPDLADSGPDAGVDLPGAPDTPVADSLPDADTATAEAGDALIVCPALPTGVVPSGTAPMQDPGPAAASTATRPQLSAALADSDYTIAKALAQGGTMTGPSAPSAVAVDGGTGDIDAGAIDAGSAAFDAGSSTDAGSTVTYALNDNWDPVTNGIGDVNTFNPLFTVASDGSGTHTTINQAITDAIPQVQCGRVYIRIKAGTYREKVVVPSKTTAAMLTLYSTEADAEKTVIVNGVGLVGLSASATMTVNAKTGFQMKNITVANDFAEDPASTADQSAVALLNQCDRAQFENVRILGNIAPLYLKSLDTSTASRSYFRDCTIEGDQDIITGRGVAVFDHTEIRYLTSRQLTGGVIANPSTVLNNRYGFLFVSCNFTADDGASGVALGHQWWESSNVSAIGKVIVRNSTLGGHIAAAPWAPSTTRTTTPKDPSGTTPVTLYTSDDFYPDGTGPSPAEIYLGEYGNRGPGAVP